MDIDRIDNDLRDADHRDADHRDTDHRDTETPGRFVIDCADCVHRSTPVCDDCVVSFIVSREADDAVVVDADEARAVRMLEHAGLLPGVRHARHAV